MSVHPRFPCTGEEIERLLFHMPAVASNAEKAWPRDFAASIVRQSRRRGWRPTPKQLDLMRRLVADLFAPGGSNDEVIED